MIKFIYVLTCIGTIFAMNTFVEARQFTEFGSAVAPEILTGQVNVTSTENSAEVLVVPASGKFVVTTFCSVSGAMFLAAGPNPGDILAGAGSADEPSQCLDFTPGLAVDPSTALTCFKALAPGGSCTVAGAHSQGRVTGQIVTEHVNLGLSAEVLVVPATGRFVVTTFCSVLEQMFLAAGTNLDNVLVTVGTGDDPTQCLNFTPGLAVDPSTELTCFNASVTDPGTCTVAGVHLTSPR